MPEPAVDHRPGEVLAAFAKLGVTSFGGPIAHLGYFRAELVERRRWVSEQQYADLVALCQFLPGPASSQVGFALGLVRGGPLGALAAFLAFTLPSAILLTALALGATVLQSPIAAAVLAGLGLVAVAVVAHAVLGMARSLTPDARRAGIAAVAAVLAVALPGSWGQIGALVLGVVGGLLLCRSADDGGAAASPLAFRIPRVVGLACLGLFLVLLVGLPISAALDPDGPLAVVAAFFSSGALVFGGGHVVLPLLQASVVDPGWVDQQTFLSGYGAAQAVPGPLFTFSAYLGASLGIAPSGILGAAVALVAIFLPGFLLLVGVIPFWSAVRGRPLVRAGMRGANAAVVGILAAALYDPVFTSAVHGAPGFALALVCFVLLVGVRVPPWAVVLVGAAGGIGLTALGAVL